MATIDTSQGKIDAQAFERLAGEFIHEQLRDGRSIGAAIENLLKHYRVAASDAERARGIATTVAERLTRKP